MTIRWKAVMQYITVVLFDNPLTPRLKTWVIQSFLTQFNSMERTLKCDYSLESCCHASSFPVARNFNLPNHSQKHMAVCCLSLHLGNSESRQNIEQILTFQIGILSPSEINKRFLLRSYCFTALFPLIT